MFGVGGTVSVAMFSIRATSRGDDTQRIHDSEIRTAQWTHDAKIRMDQLREASAARQEERLPEAVLAYAAAMKNQTRVCARLAANHGITRFSHGTIEPMEAEKLIAQYENSGRFTSSGSYCSRTPTCRERRGIGRPRFGLPRTSNTGWAPPQVHLSQIG